MATKIKRLLFLKEITKQNKIENQKELSIILKNNGFNITQATLSRDLKELKVSKILNSENKYIYILSDVWQKTPKQKIKKYSSLGFYSIAVSKNIAVIKTKSGYANSFASKIDELALPEILGTVAGDDSIILVINADFTFVELKKSLIVNIPELKNFIKL
jgi:transcriptional regulator of arginine metabolism